MTHKYLFLAGHGGEIFGEYLTADKRSPEVPPGIFEGVYNREICSLVVPALNGSGIEAEFINPGPYNIPQTERVKLVNDIHKRTGDQCILVVLHCNAARGSGWSDANGFRVFVSRNASQRSRDLSMYFVDGMDLNTALLARPTLEKNFSILAKTKCPAVLLEMFFMTNKNDVAYATSDTGKADIVRAIHAAIVDFEKEEK
jgi:N-acetylmuramoyl-L-alanine amidase